MKKSLFLFLSLFTLVVFSCNKEVISTPDAIGTVSDRDLKETCDCEYEIIEAYCDGFPNFRYFISDLDFSGSPCPNCINGLFAARYTNCVPSTNNDPCTDVFDVPVPAGWFDFNCPVEAYSQFSTYLSLGCCSSESACNSSPGITGAVKYRIKCKSTKIYAQNPKGGDSSPSLPHPCTQTFISEPITLNFDTNNGGALGSQELIEMAGNCGCLPVQQ